MTVRPTQTAERWQNSGLGLLAVVLFGASGFLVRADDLSYPATNTPAAIQPATNSCSPGYIELRRQWTDRGTPQESSSTTLRLQATPKKYFSEVRVDIPFIDEKNGDPLSPHLGDVVFKLETAPYYIGKTYWMAILETTFPTAQPESLGTGKYQLTPGVEFWVPVWASSNTGMPPRWQTGVKPLVEQFVSVAGDPSRTDINYTKIELALHADWREKLDLKLTPKFMVDYVGGVSSGAVIELEPAWEINRHWRLALTLGHSMWGVGIPGTYRKKVEFSVRYTF